MEASVGDSANEVYDSSLQRSISAYRALQPSKRAIEKRLLFSEEWMCSYVIWSTLPVSMDSSHRYPRQPSRSDYRGANTACSGGKQGQPVNGAIAITIIGTISVLMHSRNIRQVSNVYVSGWSGIVQPWAREIWEPS